MSQNQLFSEFNQLTKDDWLKKAEIDLRGKKLTDLKSNWYGINIEPYYSIEDREGKNSTASIVSTNHSWVNFVEIIVKQEDVANKLALDNLMQGATGIIFNLTGAANFSTLLANIELQHTAISFAGNIKLDEFLEYADSENIKSKLSGFVDLQEAYTSKIANIFFPSVVKGKSSDEVDELVEILQTLNNLLSPVDEKDGEITIANIAYQVEISSNYFFGIAKIRALRLLLSRFYSAYSLNYPPDKFHIIARSSSWTNEAYQPHENMLKATTAAMAAISGGCNALIINPGYADEQEELVAKNISTLLEFEAYLGKVADPAAGSYFIEQLTEDIVNKVWSTFKISVRS